MDLETFLIGLDQLLREHGRHADNLACYQCDGCIGCASSMFCERCERCYRCTHCQGSTDCSECNHCQGCRACHGSSYCRECERCIGSTHLVRCLACVDCTYCFGCVGLVKKEFQILNVRYSRKDYFEITAKLTAALEAWSVAATAAPSLPTDPDPGTAPGRT